MTTPVKEFVPVIIHGEPFYKRPIQRQRWGDPEAHAIVPWNDVFFDLFYVAAAYNLANIIVNTPTGRGLLYFTGCFWAVFTMWLLETYYEARYVSGGDAWHRLFQVSFYLVVATAILHIRSVPLLSVPSQHVDMFAFSFACVLANGFHMARYLEVILFGDGEQAAIVSSRREIYFKVIPTGLYLAATILSGVEYYSGDDGDSTNDIPIILLCSAALFDIVWGFVYFGFFFPHGERRREVSIPINTNYCIHRFGEWAMLMLGECILSLLIVEVVSKGLEYYVTFYTGIVSVCLLMYLYFFSGPTQVEEHAMLRHVQTSYFISVLMQFYSAGLVIVGASYKLFMYEYTYENYEDEFGHRLRMLLEYVRSLAGSGLGDIDESTRRQHISYFFCFSLALVWVCSDLMMLMHKGLYYNWKRFRYYEGRFRRAAVFLLLLRMGLLAFIGTLFIYVTDPHLLAAIGMCCIIAQLALRLIGNAAFPHGSDDTDGDVQGSKVSVDSGGDDDNKVSSAEQVQLNRDDGISESGTREKEAEVEPE